MKQLFLIIATISIIWFVISVILKPIINKMLNDDIKPQQK